MLPSIAAGHQRENFRDFAGQRSSEGAAHAGSASEIPLHEGHKVVQAGAETRFNCCLGTSACVARRVAPTGQFSKAQH